MHIEKDCELSVLYCISTQFACRRYENVRRVSRRDRLYIHSTFHNKRRITVLLVELYLELVGDLLLHGIVEACDALRAGLFTVHSAADGWFLHQLWPLEPTQLTQSLIAVDHREVDYTSVRKQKVAVCNRHQQQHTSIFNFRQSNLK